MSMPVRLDQLPLVGIFDAPDDGHDDVTVFGRMRGARVEPRHDKGGRGRGLHQSSLSLSAD